MRQVIRATNLPVTDAIRDHVSTRVLGAVRRFAVCLASITVVLEDVNGPRAAWTSPAASRANWYEAVDRSGSRRLRTICAVRWIVPPAGSRARSGVERRGRESGRPGARARADPARTESFANLRRGTVI